jgi:myo-inositol-1(or 4)-monophosphatase
MSDYTDLLRAVEPIARRAADTLMSMRQERLDISRKEGLDIVTVADLASERIVIEGLRALTPHASILSEEAGVTGAESDVRWIVDPLDGTINYASGLPWFSVTMAYQEKGSTKVGLTLAPAAGFEARFTSDGTATVNGKPAKVSSTSRLADAVIAVVLTSHFSAGEVDRTAEIIRRLGTAARGVRVIVSGAFEFSTVAAGQLDAAVSIKADVVSYAAAMPLLRAAGGRLTTLAGANATDEDVQKIGSNGLIHDELLDALRDL